MIPIQMDDLREQRQSWVEYWEWWLEELQRRRDEWPGYRDYSAPRGYIEIDITEDAGAHRETLRRSVAPAC